ncbi:MAG: DUF927 domain-containing protein [Ruminococcus sp.]|nr:DUF927 domain-containing protein [Ruminococcus sp.]
MSTKNQEDILVRYPLPYKVVDGNLCMEVTEKHSKYDKKLANFTPYIKSELTIDDGATETKVLRLAGQHANGEALPEIEVSGKDFPSFNWLFEKWGAKCILEVGKNVKEHVRYSIQSTSENAEQQFIYQQTGWKKIGNAWHYLLPGDSKFNVSLKGKLESYCGEQTFSKSDLETVYSMTKTLLAPKEIIYILLAFTFLAPLIEFLRQAQCMPKFVLNIIGRTGTRKSTLAALFLCFFGIFNAGNLPMSFRDTANSIIQNAFALKDVLTCIDDFHPCGRDDERKLTSTMQALVRAYGDRTGRGRLRKDSSAMESRPPLGNAIVTSEFPPDIGESGTARYFLLELKDGDINLNILSLFQQYAEQGVFRRVMFGYTEWIRKKFLQEDKIEKEFVKTLKESFAAYRSDFIQTGISCHGRVPEMTAELRIGMKMLLWFLEDNKVIAESAAKNLDNELKQILYRLAQRQNDNIKSDKPSVVFVKKLYALIESGAVSVTHKDLSIGEDPYPRNFIGFEDEHYLYLNKDIAYRHVKVLCNEQGESFSLTSKALLKTLAEDDLIKTSQGSNTVSVRYAGKNSRYMALDKFKAEQIVNST